jgi:predicted O-methyltransferase YrrM
MREHYWALRFRRVWRRWQRSPPWAGFGEPLNGQSSRQSVVRRLIELFEPHVIVETGTFLGDTTRWLAQYGVPVVTVEVEPVFFRAAQRRLRRAPNVELVSGHSVDALKMLARRAQVSKPLVYLDAHWGEGHPEAEDARNPLSEEVDAVLDSWPEAVVVIDDFLVPW